MRHPKRLPNIEKTGPGIENRLLNNHGIDPDCLHITTSPQRHVDLNTTLGTSLALMGRGCPMRGWGDATASLSGLVKLTAHLFIRCPSMIFRNDQSQIQCADAPPAGCSPPKPFRRGINSNPSLAALSGTFRCRRQARKL
jgi:hypothetical protein